MCTDEAIIDAVKDQIWNNSADYPAIHDVIDGSGPHVSVGDIDGELDDLSSGSDPDKADDDDSSDMLGPDGQFSGVVTIEVNGNVREVPNRIVFSGQVVDGKPVVKDLDWA